MNYPKSLLFIGNSATYVNDLPATLVSLCENQGIYITQKQVVKGGRFLKSHAEDPAVYEEIAKGYDVVFFQENGNAMTTEEESQKSLEGCKKLVDAARKVGSQCWFYVRPPYGNKLAGYSNFDQCILFDKHFTPAARQWNMECAYVNRAFAIAIKQHDIPLWGADNAHTGVQGAYLAVCTFYASLFGRTATELNTAYGISREDAAVLQKIADKIALEGVIPWED